ncbi:MAG: hypothetical protein R3C03_13515 [Pirellulaceae bacterium]
MSDVKNDTDGEFAYLVFFLLIAGLVFSWGLQVASFVSAYHLWDNVREGQSIDNWLQYASVVVGILVDLGVCIAFARIKTRNEFLALVTIGTLALLPLIVYLLEPPTS